MSNEFHFKSEDWSKLLKELSPTQLHKFLKSGYREMALRSRNIATTYLEATGVQPQGSLTDWYWGIRIRVYPRGGGYMITVKPPRNRNSKADSMHQNRFGKKKPILQWLEDGTEKRYSSSGWRWEYVEGRYVKKKNRYVYLEPTFRKVKTPTVYRGSMPNKDFLKKAEPEMLTGAMNDIESSLDRALQRAAKKCGFI